MGRMGAVIDSRLDQAARTVAEAMQCTDLGAQQLLAGEVMREWSSEFAGEFPATDSLIGAVTVRLQVAALHLGCGDVREARLALWWALHDMKAVKNR